MRALFCGAILVSLLSLVPTAAANRTPQALCHGSTGMCWGIGPSATPAPGYGQFAGCPSQEEVLADTNCFRAVLSNGHLQLNAVDLPFSATLTGGLREGSRKLLSNSLGGLTATTEEMPGGLIGVTGLPWLSEFLKADEMKVGAMPELAGIPRVGKGLMLPLKIRLVSPILGTNCYLGSRWTPLRLDLGTATTSPPPPNLPITGIEPGVSFDERDGVLHSDNATFVDNAFGAPGFSGCVLRLFGFVPVAINGLIERRWGLPSPSGTNSGTVESDSELTDRARVYP